METFEGVLAIKQRTFVETREVVLGVVAREGCAAEEDGDSDADGVHLFEVFAHHVDGLHEQTGHTDGVGFLFLRGFEDVGDRLLDAEVEDGVAVVGEDDVDEVFADVMDVSFDGREDDSAFARAFDFFHEGFEMCDGGLHRLGGLEDEGELHLAGAEEFADDFHSLEEEVVDDLERGVGLARFFQVLDEVAFFAVDDVALEFFFDR